jgi:hypothetical protein
MTTEHDPRTRIVLSWLREDAHENPERFLLRALDEVDTTPQRRSWWPAWRSDSMNTYAKLIVAAAAVLVVAVVGYRFLPASDGAGGQPTIAPSPSPSLLARGTFTAHGITAELDATASGADVAGTMALSESNTDNRATVDLECARTTADGLIEIGGLITDSTFIVDDQTAWHDGFPEGQRVAIVFQPGSPVNAIWNVTSADQGVTSCEAMLENLDSSGERPAPGSPGLDPIIGTVEFGP